MGDPAAPTPPWEWSTATIRALMKVRGDSAHTLAKDLYVVTRAVEGWLYDGRSPNPGSAKQLYRLWAQLDGWQREVFDSLRANPPAATAATQSPSAERPRQAAAVPTLDPPARTPGNGGSTDRGQFCKALGVTLATTPLEALERIAADLHRPGRIDAGLMAAHEQWADLLASRHYTQRADVLAHLTARHANALLVLVDRPMSDANRRRLDSIAVASHVEAGLLAYNVGDRPTARRYFATAWSLADEAGDDTLRSRTLGVAMVQHSPIECGNRGGNARRAVATMRRAVYYGRRADPVTRAYAHRRLGLELAAAGDEQGFLTSYDAGDRLPEPSGQPEGSGFLARYFALAPEQVSNKGIGLVRIGRAEEAVASLTPTLDLTNPRWTAMAVADIAMALVLQGEVEQACQELQRALSLARTAGYAMGIERVRGVRARFDPRWNDLACVRALDERLRAIPA